MFFSPFLILYAFLFLLLLGFIFVLLEIGIIHYAFGALGLPPELAFLALFASLLGSYINIPIATVDGGDLHSDDYVTYFGVRYRVPHQYAGGSTTVAINVGGAVVPIAVSLYVLVHQPSALMPAAFGVALVAAVVHRWARPLRGLGIGVPMFIPPLVAAVSAWFFAAMFGTLNHIDAIAYVSGVLGTLIGADLANLGKLRELGAPVASIGGAGTFDGIFLTGIVAVLLA
ncbi:MAG TPA: DUF1614 domain-containing protein [Candidatus Binataceae bacterium]|jgi:uncharacterized membrane protein|nr:DUF1614 domain-containing protein [Candidatus Binataceae bacterium]